MAKWRRLAALLAAAVMMALSLCGCNVVLLLGNLEETSSPVTFTSDDGRYSLTATAVWEKDPDSANALFIQRTDAREGYVTVIRDAKAELESGLTLQEYAEFYIQTLGDTREDTSVVRGALKERPAYTFDQRGSVNNIRVAYRAYCLETDDAFVAMIGWMRASDWAEHEQELQQVLESLTINE